MPIKLHWSNPNPPVRKRSSDTAFSYSDNATIERVVHGIPVLGDIDRLVRILASGSATIFKNEKATIAAVLVRSGRQSAAMQYLPYETEAYMASFGDPL